MVDISMLRNPADGRGTCTIKHDRRCLSYGSNVACLFLKLADRGLLRGFSGINEAGWDFNDYFVKGRSELLLKENFRACRTR